MKVDSMSSKDSFLVQLRANFIFSGKWDVFSIIILRIYIFFSIVQVNNQRYFINYIVV